MERVNERWVRVYSDQPGLNEKELLRLCSLDFIEKRENLIFLGPPGVGKTHLAIGFWVKACKCKYRILFISTQKLLEDLLLSVNYNFEDWGRVFQDNVVVAAIIDRLVHPAKIFYINGEDYRLKNKLKGRD